MSHTPEHIEQPWVDSEHSYQHIAQSLAPIVVNHDEDDSGSDVSKSPSEVENSSMLVQHSQPETDHVPLLATGDKLVLSLASVSTMKQRLAELEAAEDVWVTRKSKLSAKRERKDERTKNRIDEEEKRIRKQREAEGERLKKQREEEDERIKKQHEEEDAQRAHDRIAKEDRILKRREREDEENRKLEKEHDDEEYELRRRLKTLKRGLPVHEENTDSARASTVSESISPPSKKHQPNPSTIHTIHLPSTYNTMQLVQPHLPERLPSAQHPFHYGWNGPPMNEPYDYATKDAYRDQDLQSFAPVLNGTRPPVYTALPPPPPPPPPPAGPACSASLLPHHAPSTRQIQSQQLPVAFPPSYSAHPPLTSNFTSVNGPTSGFPSINQSPDHSSKTSLRPVPKKKRARQAAAQALNLDVEAAGLASPTHPPGSPTSPTSIPNGKRKASTTHPYSQSEAFANRHQHCERTDELDRGIWTYFGPGGSREAPTVAGKKEMYLRCSHDGCMRLDWKTIHGLQCHIVKNHGVAKGTIGSLELALEKYGIEVQEIEEHEKKHGLGSAGAMAEKTPRVKSRNRISNGTDVSESSTPVPGTVDGPTTGSSAKSVPASRVKPSLPIILFPNLQARSPSGGYIQDDIVYSEDESDGDHATSEIKQSARESNSKHLSRWKASNSEISVPSTFTNGGDDKLHRSNSQSAPPQSRRSHLDNGPTSLPPRPTSSTETLSVPETAPKSTEIHTTSSSNLAVPSSTQLQPIGTETQKVLSAAEKVNARLDAEDSDFIVTPADSDTMSQTQSQTEHQTLPQTQTTVSNQSNPNTKPTTSSTPISTSTPRPKTGAERRVPASERWDWAPVEDDYDENRAHDSAPTNSNINTNGANAGNTVLTKAQLELQSLDGSVADSDARAVVADDGSATAMGKSPTTAARYSARKKIQTRRGMVAYS